METPATPRLGSRDNPIPVQDESEIQPGNAGMTPDGNVIVKYGAFFNAKNPDGEPSLSNLNPGFEQTIECLDEAELAELSLKYRVDGKTVTRAWLFGDTTANGMSAKYAGGPIQMITRMPLAEDPHPDQGPDTAPPSAAPAIVPPPAPAENHQPSNDEAKNDSLGNPKDEALVGPRGANVPPEHLTEIQKAESAEAADRRAHVGMSSTDHIDSIGNPKGHFETTERGKDRHGAKRPDLVHSDEPAIEPHQPMVGPRGVGAPKDSFHKRRG